MTTQQEENEPSATGNTGDTGSTENNGDTGNTGVDNLALPTWQLKDIQPKSERFGDVYGLDHFKGEVLVALLIEGFWTICAGQVDSADSLVEELETAGLKANIVLLSDSRADYFVDETSTSLPIFQDDGQGKPAWDQMEEDARKHDTFVYSKEGERLLFRDASDSSLENWKSDIYNVIKDNQ